MTTTALAAELGMSQPAVSRAVQRGEKMAGENGWRLADLLSALTHLNGTNLPQNG